MPELLVEVGCEELPAWAVEDGAEALRAAIEARLEAARLPAAGFQTYATPRRWIVAAYEVPAERPGRTETVRGPASRAAYGPDGRPTKALEGFCRSKGVDAAAVRMEGDYVWADVMEPGGPAAEVLPGLLAEALGSLGFAKTMRWGDRRERFVRPVRWLLATFGGEPVEFEFAGIRSGVASRGHRFLSPGEFEARTLEALVAGLRGRNVEPDPARRAATIRERAAQASGGAVVLDERLVIENAALTESPACHAGGFADEYLALPEEVLATVLAKHERFFVVRGPDGRLDTRFVVVRNGGEEDAVRRGNEWVVNSRLADAMFFWLEDAKKTMAEFLEATRAIGFHAGLGDVRARADRLSALAYMAALATGADEAEAGWAREAGLLAKADLAAGLVGELAELQGAVGGLYLAREGAAPEVCEGVARHYGAPEAGTPGRRTAARVLVADQIDKLAGYLGSGIEPKGSSDPYGLRRAANLLVEAAWAWQGPFGGYAALFCEALRLYAEGGIELDSARAEASFLALMHQRYEPLMPGFRPDVVAAAVPDEAAAADPRGVRLRAQALAMLAEEPALVQNALRPVNIVLAAHRGGHAIEEGPLDRARLASPEGEALWEACERQAPLAHQAVQAEAAGALVQALRPLAAPTEAFFDATMVMHEDPAVRTERLRVAAWAARLWSLAGDLSKIVVAG
jgi:glycyl-tRNA synthetase beta chain